MGEYADFIVDNEIMDWDGKTVDYEAGTYNIHTIPYSEILRETEKAYYIMLSKENVFHCTWFPKKHTHVMKLSKKIMIPKWLSRAKGKEIHDLTSQLDSPKAEKEREG